MPRGHQEIVPIFSKANDIWVTGHHVLTAKIFAANRKHVSGISREIRCCNFSSRLFIYPILAVICFIFVDQGSKQTSPVHRLRN